MPNKAAGIRGCAKCPTCTLSVKCKSFAEGGGPRRYAWERIFKGKPVRRMEGECWTLVADKEFVEDNGGAIRIVAHEGQTYEKLEGVAVKDVVVDGVPKKVLANEVEQRVPNVLREDMVVTKTVKPFLRPSENATIATDIITANVLREESARLEAESVHRALGLEGASAPLDRRDEGTSKRKK